MKKKLISEQGFSLLELLVSLVIFTIVITSFMGFFFQSSIFIKKNEDDLIAINLAREVLEIIKQENDQKTSETQIFKVDSNEACDINFDPAMLAQKELLNLASDGTFQSNSKLYPCFTFKKESNIENDVYHTYQVTVYIYQNGEQGRNDQLLTKTYGYVREAK